MDIPYCPFFTAAFSGFEVCRREKCMFWVATNEGIEDCSIPLLAKLKIVQ